MVELSEHPEGIVLPIRAHANAKANTITGVQNGALKVAVTSAPERGKANKAIIVVLSKQLKLRKSQIELISGPTSKQKRFLVRGVTLAALSTRISDRIA